MNITLIFTVLAVVWNFINDCSNNPKKREEYIEDKKFFTRKRRLPFKIVVGIILNNLKSNLMSNLQNFLFWNDYRRDSTYPFRGLVTPAAFSEQREKIKSNFFVDLLNVFVNAFYTHYAPNVKKWKQWVLTAIDGSRVSLPDNRDTKGRFGTQKHAKSDVKTPLARASFAYDVLNHIILTGHLVNKKISEIKMAIEDILHLKSGFLFLMDRGYCSFVLMYLMMKRENKFVCRAKIRLLKSVKTFIEKGLKDDYVEIKAYHQAVKQLKENGYTVKHGETIKVRAVRIPLSSGETEVLLTNLSPEEATVAELAELYHLRWNEEVAIGILKNEEQLEIFTGVSTKCIEQDFFSTLFLYNFEMMLEKIEDESVQETNKKHKRKGELPQAIDHNQCWNSTKRIFSTWIRANNSEEANNEIKKILPLFADNRYSVREGRKFPRTFRVIKLLGKYITLNNYRAVG